MRGETKLHSFLHFPYRCSEFHSVHHETDPSHLSSKSITDIYILITAALHLQYLCSRNGADFVGALRIAPASAVVFVVGILALPPVLALLGYHIRVRCSHLS